MKYIKLSLFGLCLTTLLSCNSQKSTVTQSETTETEEVAAPTSQPEMLTGPTKRYELQTGTFGEWFNPFYASYRVDESLVKEIKPLIKDVDITLFMGTWCGDSKRETPRIYKIFDAVGKSEDVELITVDRSKTTPQGLEKGRDITRVPTLILSKDGEELGRIVEYPIESLEADMLKILKGEPYKHAYAD